MPLEDDSVDVDVPSSDDDHDVLGKSKLVEPKPRKKLEPVDEEEEKPKKKKDFIAHTPINVKSNKEAMKTQKENEQQSKRKQLEQSLRKNLHKNKKPEHEKENEEVDKDKK